MRKYKVLRTVNLTVAPGSVVLVSDEQYRAAKDYLEPATETDSPDVPARKQKALNKDPSKG